MSFVYLLLEDRDEWDNLVIFLNEEEAISASLKNPNSRVEIFRKKKYDGSHIPTYWYYKNGKLFGEEYPYISIWNSKWNP